MITGQDKHRLAGLGDRGGKPRNGKNCPDVRVEHWFGDNESVLCENLLAFCGRFSCHDGTRRGQEASVVRPSDILHEEWRGSWLSVASVKTC